MPEVKVLLLTVTESHTELDKTHESVEGVLRESEEEEIAWPLVEDDLDLAAEVVLASLGV